jgi:hypothetical protein
MSDYLDMSDHTSQHTSMSNLLLPPGQLEQLALPLFVCANRLRKVIFHEAIWRKHDACE